MAYIFLTDTLKNFLEKNPESVTFAHLAARCIDEGDYQKAVDICRKGLEKHPQYSFGYFVLGNALYHLKNYTDAKRELEKALAYDPNNPKAWEILSAINEILNLGEDAKESNVLAYLIDFFKTDASPNFLPLVETPSFEWKTETTAQEELVSEVPEVPLEELDQEKIGDMLGEVVSKDQEDYDFEKALDEVFQNQELESIQTPPAEGLESETMTEMTEPAPETEQDDMISAQEFTSEIESFFSSYEEPEKSPASQPDQPPDVVEATPPPSESEVVELEMPAPPESAESPLPPEKKVTDELLDFKSFISDIIKDQDEAVTTEPAREEVSAAEISEKAEKFLKEEDFNLPEAATPPQVPEKKVVEVEKIEEITSKEKKITTRKATTKVTKPPILSPTLGEIYIAQGRFEEAIEVFRQLLQKDPENPRFRRKIEDLQKILAKKNLGAK